MKSTLPMPLCVMALLWALLFPATHALAAGCVCPVPPRSGGGSMPGLGSGPGSGAHSIPMPPPPILSQVPPPLTIGPLTDANRKALIRQEQKEAEWEGFVERVKGYGAKTGEVVGTAADWVGWAAQTALGFIPFVSGTVTVPLDAGRAGAETYGKYIDAGHSQGEAAKAGAKAAAGQAVVSTLSALTFGNAAGEEKNKVVQYTLKGMENFKNLVAGKGVSKALEPSAKNSAPTPNIANSTVSLR